MQQRAEVMCCCGAVTSPAVPFVLQCVRSKAIWTPEACTAVQMHLHSRLCRSNGAEMGEQVATDRTCAAPLVMRFFRMTPSATDSRCN